MTARSLLLFGVLFAVLGVPLRADENLRGIFATVHSGKGGTCLLDLHVPKSGGGACELRHVTVATTPTVTTRATSRMIPLPSVGTPAAGVSLVAQPAPAPAPIFHPGPGISPQAAMEMSWYAVVLPEIGSLTTHDSTAYSNCRLVAFQTDGVIVLHDEGLSKIMFSDLDSASRVRIRLLR